MDSFELELKSTFLQEARQLLDEAEGDSLALAQGQHTKESLQKLFRLAHTFKGSAKAVGFEALSNLAHELEEILDRMNKGILKPTPDLCTGILKIIDGFQQFIKGLTHDLNFELPNYQELMKDLECLKDGISTPAPAPASEPSPLSSEVPPLPEGKSLPRLDGVPEMPPSKPEQTHPKVTQPKQTNKQKSNEAKPTGADDIIRISALKLDRLINMIGELKVHRQVLSSSKMDLQERSPSSGNRTESAASWGTGYIDKIINEVHDVAMSLRMTPIRPVFQKMQRVIWDSGISLGKEVHFVTHGEEVELDKVIVDKVGDALVHLIRNAIDHGIESTEERMRKGKSPQGTITLQAQVRENQVTLTVSDDGNGLDRDKILKKGIETGLIQTHLESFEKNSNSSPSNLSQNLSQKLSDDEIYHLIFEPGFSTRSEVTNLSGRGFGMDVVKQLVEEIGGGIEIKTRINEGTQFILTLPLILSVIQGLVVLLAGRKYIIPLSQIIETVDLEKISIEKKYDHSPIFSLRGEVLPILNLSQLLHGRTDASAPSELSEVSKANNKPNRGLGIVVGARGKKIAFEVEHVLESQPMALKPLGPELKDMPGITAGAILGDGEPVLVLNLQELVPEGRNHGLHE